MPSRLEIHSCAIELESDDNITIGGYAVLDNLAGIVRYVSVAYSMCERWIETWGHKYPEPEDDDLS